MKKFFSFAFVASFLALTVACNSGGGESGTTSSATPAGGDATATTNTATPAAGTDPAANPTENAVDPNVPKTTVKFAESEYDFGKVKEGEKVVHVYKFTNTGKEPLIINSAKGSCGCTVPEWPKDPVAPGATGEIKVEFNSKGKVGQQSKTVTIMANTDPNPSQIIIKGVVEKDPNAPAPAAAAPGGAQPQIQVQPQGGGH